MSTTPDRGPIRYDTFESPLGEVLVTADLEGITGVYLEGQRGRPEPTDRWLRDPEGLAAARAQLLGYFAGTRRRFDLLLRPVGTQFQQSVWSLLMGIEFGTTVTYGELARRLGRPGASRAVGSAVGQNPISVVIPCHRVLGASGSLTGYAGGLEAKRWLLRHETGNAAGSPCPPVR